MFTIFMINLFFIVWQLRIERLFDGKFELGKAVKWFEMQVNEYVDLTSKAKTTRSSTSLESELFWSVPLKGWLKINVDALMRDTKVVLAFAIRDHKGKLLFLSTIMRSCRMPFEAELKALDWASNYVAICSWNKFI